MKTTKDQLQLLLLLPPFLTGQFFRSHSRLGILGFLKQVIFTRQVPFLLPSQQCQSTASKSMNKVTINTHTTVLRPYFRDHPGEPVPEENFWTLWCKGRFTEADTLTIRLGATPCRLTSAHHHPLIFFTGRMSFLPSNQQC